MEHCWRKDCEARARTCLMAAASDTWNAMIQSERNVRLATASRARASWKSPRDAARRTEEYGLTFPISARNLSKRILKECASAVCGLDSISRERRSKLRQLLISIWA